LPEANTCVLLNSESTKPTVVGALVTDIPLLLFVFLGLLRLCLEAGGEFGLGRNHWKQLQAGAVVVVFVGCDTPKSTNVNFCS
jgi:hypothetical protein